MINIKQHVNRIPWKISCLILITMAVYWPVRRYNFVEYDDATYLTSNPFIKQGVTRASVHDAFTRARFANYAPLVSISYYVDQDLFHLKPGPMHVENVLLHLLAGLLLWRLIIECTGEVWRGYVVAILFLCHPMHVESVAWISERKDVLSTVFLIASMIAYVRFTRQSDPLAKTCLCLAILVLYTASLLTKSMGVTLPAVLLLLDYWPLCRRPGCSWTRLVVEKIPLIVLTILTAVAARVAQNDALDSLELISISARVSNAMICYLIYMAKLAIPMNLAVFYPHPLTRPAGAGVSAAGILLIITWGCWRLRYSKPYLIVGWLWFLGTLVPVIGLVQVGAQAMADRYSYFPSIGLFIASVWGISDLLRASYVKPTFAIACIAAFSVVARKQVLYWKDSRTLFTHATEVTERNYLAFSALGVIALEQHDLRGAADQFEIALSFAQDPGSYDGMGDCLVGADRPRAINCYKRAVSLSPSVADYRLDLAAALRLNREFDQAKEQIQAALKIDPVSDRAREELVKLKQADSTFKPIR